MFPLLATHLHGRVGVCGAQHEGQRDVVVVGAPDLHGRGRTSHGGSVTRRSVTAPPPPQKKKMKTYKITKQTNKKHTATPNLQK